MQGAPNLTHRGRWLGLLLAAVTLLVFAPALGNRFLLLDDDRYITRNEHVTPGITLAGISWAFTSTDRDNWHPLTWIGHMLAVEISGLRPWGHHLLSALLHATAALLLFAFLARTTGAVATAFFASALFALHPLRVESVAWAAELKDPLAGVFFMLVLLGYARYAARGKPRDYLLLLFVFALGLMAKPMLVALPLLLLGLDHWPLHRWSARAARSLLLEKIPLLLLAAAAGVLTLIAQSRAEALRPLHELPLSLRLVHAPVAAVAYLGKFFRPVHFSAFYPHPGDALTAVQAIAAGALLLALTALAFHQLKSRPYLAAGWFWYLVMLAPVSGIAQAGYQGFADRYTYLPQIGLGILLAWGGADLARGLRLRRAVPLAAAGFILILAALTPLRIRAWHDTQRLFEDALRSDPDNWFAHLKIAEAQKQEGRTAEALAHARRAVAAAPHVQNLRFLYGTLLGESGRYAEEERELREALRLAPGWPDALLNLGISLSRQRRYEEAVVPLRELLRREPGDLRALQAIAAAEIAAGHLAAAEADCRTWLRLEPQAAAPRAMLGRIAEGRRDPGGEP